MTIEYLHSHPWLTFKSNFERAQPAFWAMLGECQSKCEHIAGVPLKPDVAKKMHHIYLAKGVWGTTAIEGNTLSEEEVLRRIEGGLDEVPPSREYLRQEIDNIIGESNRILGLIREDVRPRLSTQRIKEINGIVLKGLTLEEGVIPGEIRTYSVGVLQYRGAPAQECEYLLDRLCDWLNGPEFEPQSGFGPIHMAILKATIAHLYIEWIHPFGDGNGRTGRMIEVQILLSSGVSSPAAHLLSNHYNLTRTEYLRQLDRASKSGGDTLPFVAYALQGLLDGLKGQLAYIRTLQMDISWVNYVHDYFRHRETASAERQKLIMLDILQLKSPIAIQALPKMFPKIAVAYSHKHPRTLIRDINALIDQRLLVKSPEGVRPNDAIMSDFLPVKVKIV